MGILLEEAAEASGAGGINLFSYLLIWVLMIALLWFLMLRPQNKEKKRIAAMLSTLEAGDSVQTTSGFFGTVIDIVDNDTVIVEFGNNKNCRIPMDKAAISKVEKPGE
ncbi:MAG: preprotein translocase subunit YajC [Acetatifactor sp.]|nr:preprotein translocase subunit YajC [Acetatifactor sp.]